MRSAIPDPKKESNAATLAEFKEDDTKEMSHRRLLAADFKKGDIVLTPDDHRHIVDSVDDGRVFFKGGRKKISYSASVLKKIPPKKI